MKRLISLALTALLFVGLVSCGNPAPKSTSPSFDDVLTTRRSVRSYDATKSISQEEITTLLTAVQEAPSWANMEPTKYYVAIGEEKRAALLDMVGGNKERVINAPVLIVSTFESSRSGFFRGQPANEAGELWGAYDNGLSNAYLVLKAREMGFDTLIMGMRNADAIRAEFEIPENEIIMAVISVGYRAEEPKRPERRALDDVVKFF
jgi:nitroreductase